VYQAERELAVRVLSVQRNGGAVLPVSRNSARFAWRLTHTGALRMPSRCCGSERAKAAR